MGVNSVRKNNVLGDVNPLVIATGAGANSRRSLGTTVVGGLAVATVLIILVPIFYYTIQTMREWTMRRETPASTTTGSQNTN